ncbi:MAG: DUF2891 domain-containing protein [Putridiphycobacter sp.]|nr:DUF2891 domain-containing protein [Putridiphycobacter sp.]
MKQLLSLLLCLPLYTYAQEFELTYEKAEQLADIPLGCINQEYPNKLGQVLNEDTDLKTPQKLHPIFYGCFDWHSSVHGHWLLTKFLNDYPASNLSNNIASQWNRRFTTLNVIREVNYFSLANNTNFERTYGWAWLLKLQMALNTSDHQQAKDWATALQPLSNIIVEKYKSFLPKLSYPIRVGEHTNTAFGLTFALDYAKQVNDSALINLIHSRARDFYANDCNCPIDWEPSGYDFLSPCLQEANLMADILAPAEFNKWIKQFIPQLLKKKFTLEPGKVLDRTDGKLVHLDGLNFSRAWCLYRLAKHLPKQKTNLIAIADTHLKQSMSQVIGSHYMGSHWLASFLVYALEMREAVVK